jgi:hypothetical protein
LKGKGELIKRSFHFSGLDELLLTAQLSKEMGMQREDERKIGQEADSAITSFTQTAESAK